MPRVCETLATWWTGNQTKATITRFDGPRSSDGCQIELLITGNDGSNLLTLDLTQTITRMMEAEVACQSRAYLLACERAGCQPCWSPPAGGPGDPEAETSGDRDATTYAQIKRAIMEELKAEFLADMRRDIKGDLS